MAGKAGRHSVCFELRMDFELFVSLPGKIPEGDGAHMDESQSSSGESSPKGAKRQRSKQEVQSSFVRQRASQIAQRQKASAPSTAPIASCVYIFVTKPG